MNRFILIAAFSGVAGAANAVVFDFETLTEGVFSSVQQTSGGMTVTAIGVGENITVYNYGAPGTGARTVVGGRLFDGVFAPIRFDLSSAVSSASVMFGDGGIDNDGVITLYAYNAANALVGQQSFNYGTSGTLETLTVSGANITYLIGSAAGAEPGRANSVLWDNLTVTPVPEPASLAALTLGAVALIRRRRSGK